MSDKPLIIACRGDRQSFPENTLPAFDSAIARRADGIELDVHFTADEKLVVHHPFNLGLTDNGAGIVCEHSLAELQALDSGGWFGEQFRGLSKPSLGEVLEHCRGRTRFEIDMKDSSLAFLRAVIREVERREVVEAVELTTAHYPLLAQAKRINPRLRTGTFFYAPPDWMPLRLAQRHIADWVELLKIDVVHLNIVLMDPEFIARLRRRGRSVYGSNLDSAGDIRKGLELGIDCFSTGDVALAVSLRDGRPRSSTTAQSLNSSNI